MRALKWILPLAAALAVAAIAVGGVAMAEDDGDLGILGNKKSVVAAFVKEKKAKKGASEFECTAVTGGANTNLDCDDPFPNNEPDIEVDPANPLHMVASSNDYGSCCDEYYTTFDGGATWSTGNMSTEKPGPLGPIGSDPVTVFDTKHDVTLHSSLNFFLSKDFEETCNGDLVVSPSKDGGLTWERPVVVDQGLGCDLDHKQLFNDKEWIVTDNNPSSKFYGRSYVTWTKFESHDGEFVRSAIFESHSDDGGRHWSKSEEISGTNAALCTFQETGHEGQCDEDQFSVPTVGPDGTVYVAFENSQNEALWEPGEFGRRPVPARHFDGRRQALVAADVHRRPRGRLERLPDQRRRPADAHRLPGARQLSREHRREPEDGSAVPHVLRQPERHPRRGEPGDEHERVRAELDERRRALDGAGARRRGRGRPVVPVGGGQPANGDDRRSRTTTAARRTGRSTTRRSPKECPARSSRRR